MSLQDLLFPFLFFHLLVPKIPLYCMLLSPLFSPFSSLILFSSLLSSLFSLLSSLFSLLSSLFSPLSSLFCHFWSLIVGTRHCLQPPNSIGVACLPRVFQLAGSVIKSRIAPKEKKLWRLAMKLWHAESTASAEPPGNGKKKFHRCTQPKS